MNTLRNIEMFRLRQQGLVQDALGGREAEHRNIAVPLRHRGDPWMQISRS